MQLDDILILPNGPVILGELQKLAQDTIKAYQKFGRAEGLADDEYIQISQAHIILALIDALVGEQ